MIVFGVLRRIGNISFMLRLWKEDVVPHLFKLESPSPKGTFCKVFLNLTEILQLRWLDNNATKTDYGQILHSFLVEVS